MTNVILTISNPTLETFDRKSGAVGQKILFIDDKLYRHEIEAVDQNVFDFSDIMSDKVNDVSFVCEVKNQRVTLNFGDKGSRTAYVNVFKAISIASIS